MESWLTIQPLNGKGNSAILISAGRNRGPERTATVTITCGSLSKTLEIKQPANPLMRTVTADLRHPNLKMYTYVQDDDLYDNFEQIGLFKVRFSYCDEEKEFIARCDAEGEDGSWCSSETLDDPTLVRAVKLYATKMLASDGQKYIQLACQ